MNALKNIGIVCIAIISLWLVSPGARGQNITTWGCDLTHDDLNSQETTLTPANVSAAGSFGLVFTHTLDGKSYSQPLYVGGVTIGGVVHNVVYLTTEHDGVYAFDADNATGTNANPLWYDSLIPAGTTTVPSGDSGSGDVTPEIGITATPVIDTTTNTLYTVSKVKTTATSTYQQYIHALDISTGVEKFGGPFLVSATFRGLGGLGEGGGNGTFSFNTLVEHGRPALVLYNGIVYVTYASHGDAGNYHGIILGFNASTLALVKQFITTPNGTMTGIWQAGAGPAVDSAGNMYIATANGAYDQATNPFTTDTDWGESFLKLPTSGTFDVSFSNPLNWFTPNNYAALTTADEDLGSSGLLLLPDQTGGTHPHLLVGGGKGGTLYVVDRDNMGGLNTSHDNAIQEITVGPIFSTPAYFNGSIYYDPLGDHLYQRAVGFNAATGNYISTTGNASSVASNANGNGIFISANGTSNGIVWFPVNSNPSQLFAFNAANVSGTPLYTFSCTDPATNPPTNCVFSDFTMPTVTNGKAYIVAVDNNHLSHLFALGLLGGSGSVPAAPTNLAASAVATNRLTLNWTDNASNESGFIIQRATAAAGPFTQIGTTGANIATYSDSGLIAATTYYYKVLATNSTGNSPPTNTITVTTQPPVIAPGLIAYWNFDEGTGLILDDLTPNGHNGALNGEVDWIPGYQSIGALNFHGAGNATANVTVPASPALEFTATQSFSLTAWVLPGALHTVDEAVIAASRDVGNYYGLWLNSTSNWTFRGPGGDVVGSAATTTAWTNIALVQDGTAGTRTIYVNGVSAGTGAAQAANGTGNFLFGQANGVTNPFPGAIDEVRIYSRALPSNEVVGLMNNTLPVITSAGSASGNVGSAFSYQITATNSPTSYSATGLPGGLSINTVSGAITGTPTTGGTTTVTIGATNSSGTGIASLKLTFSPPPVITSGTSASGIVGNTFSYQIAATNSPTSFSATGLPTGLAVNTSTGVISGVPTASGTSSITIGATNSSGTGTATLTLTVSASGAFTAIGMQFVGGGTAMVSTDSAGVPAVAQTKWIPLTGASFFSGVALTDNTGAATTAVLTGGADGTYICSSNFPAGSGNNKMCAGELVDGDINSETHSFTVSTIPYAQYDVYIYGACDGGGRNSTFTVTPAGGAASSKSFITETNGSSWTEGTNTWNGSGTPPTLAVANYVHFTGLTASSFLLKWGGVGNVGMNGIQIVKTSASGGGSAPAITSSSSASGTVGLAFNYQITATNTPTSYSATGLPGGLSVNTSTGAITGTPTASGTSSVTIGATNASGTGTATLTLTVSASGSAPAITSSTSASGTVGSAFSYQITATNSPTSYSATGLPGGLTVNTSTGAITGTPTATGTSSVTIGATNAIGTGTATLTLTVSAAGTQVSIAMQFVGSGTALVSTDSAGVPAVAQTNWKPLTGATFSAVALTDNTGAATTASLTGSSDGSYFCGSNFTAGTGNGKLCSGELFDGDINSETHSMTISSIPYTQYDIYIYGQCDTANRNATYTVTPAGGAASSKSFLTQTTGSTWTEGTNTWNGSGTPPTLTAANYVHFTGLTASSFVLKWGGVGNVAMNGIQIVKTSTGGNPPVITSSTSASGTVGTAFSYQITATNTPTSYSATGLPGGLSVNTSTGAITGTPTASGTSSVTIGATNASGTGTATLTLTVSAASNPPVITSSTSASGTVGSAFSYQITATNTPTSYSATGLPGGLSVNTSTGAITGTPTASGTSSVTIGATNASGTGTATLTLTVSAAGTQNSIAVQFVGQGTAFVATDSAGVPAVAQANWKPLTGSSFSAVALTDNTGAATAASLTGGSDGLYFCGSGFTSGTGNAKLCAGELFDGDINSQTHTMTISSIPYAQYDVYIYGECDAPNRNATYTVTPAGGTASSKSFLTQNNGSTWTEGTNTWNGSGTPPTLTAGNYVHFTGLTATSFVLKWGGVGNVGMNGIQIVKTATGGNPPVITSSTSASGTVGSAFTYQITATNTPTSYSATGLPGGLSVNTSTGAITGTPTASGTSSVTIGATNASGTGTATLTLTISAASNPPVITSSTSASGTVGSAFSYQITATNSPTSYSATSLPGGLSVNTSTGAITGTPTASGTSSVTIGATNASGLGTATLTLTISAAGSQHSIAVQFVGSGTALVSTDSAGLAAVAQTNWKPLTGAIFSGVALPDSTGAGTTASLSGSAAGSYFAGGSSATPAGNSKLASGELFNSWPSGSTLTFTNIPYAKYDVYVYAAIDSSGRNETVSMTPSGGTAQYFSFLTEGGGSAWAVATSTWNGSGTAPTLPAANYVHFTNVTTSSFSLFWGAPGNGGMNGVQIVPTP